MKDVNSALLPSGLVDLLPPEAAREAEAVYCIMKEFEAFGYDRVKPPLAEFEESLFAQHPGKVVSGETFRLMDPVSQKMMALRSDTTAQIARIAATRLEQEARPLRLAYAGEVLRIKGSQVRPEREFVKAGCELIGSHDVQADIELAVLAVRALEILGIKEITIDLTLPPLVREIYSYHQISPEEQSGLNVLLESRDRNALAGSGNGAAETLGGLIDCMGPVEKALPGLKEMELPDRTAPYVEALGSIVDGIRPAFVGMGAGNVSITLDPVEQRGFGYHTGYAFTLFAKSVRGELGRGGRYNISGNGGRAETAAGFTLYMDTLRRALPDLSGKKRLLVSAGEDWSRIVSLQKEGWIVVRDIEGGAGKRCTHILKNGKIQEI